MGGWEGYTGYPARHLPGPIFNIYLRRSPTYGQMKANYEVSMRFPRMGPERVQNGSRIGLRMTLPDWS